MRGGHALVARAAILVASGFTAGLQLFVESSLASRAAGDGSVMDALSYGVLALCGLGAADVVWHDLRGRLIWPSFPAELRHRICASLYLLLGAAFAVRSFVAAGDPHAIVVSSIYYACFAAIAVGEAWCIAREQR